MDILILIIVDNKMFAISNRTIDNITETNLTTGEKKSLNKLDNGSSSNGDSNFTNKDRIALLTSTLEKQSMLPQLMITKSIISLFSYEEMKKLGDPIKIINSNLSEMGDILIEFPSYNPIFIQDVVSILNSVCNDCGGLLIIEDVIKQKGWHLLAPEKRLSEIEQYCKGINCYK